MRSAKNLLLLLSTVAFAMSAVAFVLSYAVTSSAGPSLVMALAEQSGGVKDVVVGLLEEFIPPMPEDPELRDKVLEAAIATLPPDTVRELAGQAIACMRAYVDSAGLESAALLDLRGVKATFLNELKDIYQGSLDDIEIALEEIPDRTDLAGLIPVEVVREAARPYRMVSNLPAISVTVAVASLLLMCLVAGPLRSASIAGWSLLTVSVIALIGSYASLGRMEATLPDVICGPTLQCPPPIDPSSLLTGTIAFVAERIRLVSGIGAIAGAAAAFVPPTLTRRSTKKPS